MTNYYFYDEAGDPQESPNSATAILSEKDLSIFSTEEFTMFPSNISFSKNLITGEKEDIVLEGEYILKGVIALDIKHHPTPTDFDEMLVREYGMTLRENLSEEDYTEICVVEHLGSRIWFSKRSGCFLKDIEKYSKNVDIDDNDGCLTRIILACIVLIVIRTFIF